MKHHNSTILVRSFLRQKCLSDLEQFICRVWPFCRMTKANIVYLCIACRLDGFYPTQCVPMKISVASCNSPFIESTQADKVNAFLCCMPYSPFQKCSGQPFAYIRPVKTLKV